MATMSVGTSPPMRPLGLTTPFSDFRTGMPPRSGQPCSTGVYAIDVDPVRPAGPTRAALRTRHAPSRDGRRGGGEDSRPPAVLVRWRVRVHRLPCPSA